MLSAPAWSAGRGAAPQAAHTSAPGLAYRLVELPSGRVVAEARPDVLATAVAPGSVLKLATLIAAVEDRLVDDRTRIACRRTATVDGRPITCVHPDLHRPLTAAEAIGYSCNVFFATVAQRLSRQSLDGVLVRLGLPPLAAGAPTASGALGLAGVRATPPQLLEAFLRVVGASRQAITMPETARRILRTGTELAARAGTASALAAAGYSGLAKTGTAPMPGGGYAGIVTAVVNAELPTHAIVVVVPGGAGADAAVAAARLLVRYGAPRRQDSVLVGVADRDGGYGVISIAIEDYVSRVVAGEIDDAPSPEALEALAITVRTFVEANRGRHAADGFDVCDLTHCQVMGRSRPATDAAARSTSGLVLMDRGQPAQVYYSSWCGGHTESPSRAWRGARDVAYLPARPDAACADEPGWTTEIPEPQLRRVLEFAGLKGIGVSRFAVASRDLSGRIAQLEAGGMTPDRLDANAFRAAAGRLLGWQSVKSTMFDVSRSGTGYVLTGRGSGHGVGLCVRGAANRGRMGASRDEILSAYFPGLAVAPRRAANASSGPGSGPDTRIRVLLPESDRNHLSAVRSLAADSLLEVAARLQLPPPAEIQLVFHPSVEAYGRATGQPWWTAARTTGARIDLLPRAVLEKRAALAPTLRHEFVHVLADQALSGRALWVREGLAVVVAGEPTGAATGAGEQAGPAGSGCPSDDDLRAPRTADAWRRAYEAAGRCVVRALAAGVRWQDVR